VGKPLKQGRADAVAMARYLEFYESSWRLMPGTEAFLSKTTHFQRAIVTNGNGTQVRRKLETLNLSVHFQVVVTPDDCGARKPEQKIFSHALNLLGVSPLEAMMIGDNEETDIAPALARRLTEGLGSTFNARACRVATEALSNEGEYQCVERDTFGTRSSC
jgi:putative hydrolase of the HAD superfamily